MFELECEPGSRLPSRPDHLDLLVRTLRNHEQILTNLRALREQAARARCYLAQPGGNTALARAYLERLLAKRSALLALLRANRLEARRLAGDDVAPEAAAACPLGAPHRPAFRGPAHPA
jgi:hypothetical protein